MAGFARNLMSFTGKALGMTGGQQTPAAPIAPTLANPGYESARRQSLMNFARSTQGVVKRKGRAGTLLTGPNGLSSPAPVARKSLLGE